MTGESERTERIGSIATDTVLLRSQRTFGYTFELVPPLHSYTSLSRQDIFLR